MSEPLREALEECDQILGLIDTAICNEQDPMSAGMIGRMSDAMELVTAALASPAAEGEPVAWTGSGSLSAVQVGLEGHIWPNREDSHPIALYTRSAPSQPVEPRYAALDEWAQLAHWVLCNVNAQMGLRVREGTQQNVRWFAESSPGDPITDNAVRDPSPPTTPKEKPWSQCGTCRGRRKVANPKSFSKGHAVSCAWAKAGGRHDLSPCDCNLTIWCPDCQEDRSPTTPKENEDAR